MAKVRNRGSGSFSCVYGMFVYRMIIHERQRELDTYTGIGLFCVYGTSFFCFGYTYTYTPAGAAGEVRMESVTRRRAFAAATNAETRNGSVARDAALSR